MRHFKGMLQNNRHPFVRHLTTKHTQACITYRFHLLAEQTYLVRVQKPESSHH